MSASAFTALDSIRQPIAVIIARWTRRPDRLDNHDRNDFNAKIIVDLLLLYIW